MIPTKFHPVNIIRTRKGLKYNCGRCLKMVNDQILYYNESIIKYETFMLEPPTRENQGQVIMEPWLPDMDYLLSIICSEHQEAESYISNGNFKTHGLSKERRAEFVATQIKKCSICKKTVSRLNVDHCHKTGKTRGLLCTNCNIGLGNFKDNIEILKRAIKYLKQS